jgi:hypothetical protein
MLPDAPLAECDAARLSMDLFAIFAKAGLPALTFLRVATSTSPAETPADLVRASTLCPNLKELHLVSGVTGDLEVPAVLASLADPAIFAQLAVLTFTQFNELPAEADRAADTWRRSRGDKVDLHLQVVSEAEWARL